MNVWTKFHSNPVDVVIFPWIKEKYDLMVKSLGFIGWGWWMSVSNFVTIHLIVVEIFDFEPKWRTNQLDQHCRAISKVKNVKNAHTVLHYTQNPKCIHSANLFLFCQKSFLCKNIFAFQKCGHFPKMSSPCQNIFLTFQINNHKDQQ